MNALDSGQVLAKRFTLVRRLGAGISTETWLAKDKMTRADVALKVSTDPGRDALLRREWQVSIRLVHPHIVRVFEFEGQSPAFYSQQFIDGPDLSCMAGRPVADSLPALVSLAHALQYAHGRGIVHRDLKASNVLLSRQGETYLIDFGVAAQDEDNVGGGSLIASSPERLGGGTGSPADDVFALGGLFYEILRGRSPYSSTHTADDIRTLVPVSLASVDGLDIPSTLSDLIDRMLHKSAAERPSMDEVVATFDELGVRPGLVSIPDLQADAMSAQNIQPTSIQPTRRIAAKPSAVEDSPGGISVRALAIGLVVLVGALLSVVFLLPSAVNGPEPAVQTKPAESPTDSVPAPADADTGTETAVDPVALRQQRIEQRAETEEVLGELLAKLETLEERAVERWGGLDYSRANAIYEAGDAAYLRRDYPAAREKYLEAIDQVDPLLDRVDRIFAAAMSDGREALENANAPDAVSAFELAVAISQNSSAAKTGLERARNLGEVLALVDQGIRQERELELALARQSFARAVELDPRWTDAAEGLRRVEAAIEQRAFEARMSEGISALTSGDLLAARAAFRMADQLRPGAAEPADGLLQVEQEMRLRSIAELEREVRSRESAEQWELAVESYQELLEIDSSLQFAKEGMQNAQAMVDLYARIDAYIADPDQLSRPTAMQRATQTIIEMTRMPDIGPRLAEQRDELSRLLKRASTSLSVQLVSDNKTAVSVYRVGRLGSFESTELNLKPGSYVAVGSRPGFRDVRVEFRVAPELDMKPVVVRCEEPI